MVAFLSSILLLPSFDKDHLLNRERERLRIKRDFFQALVRSKTNKGKLLVMSWSCSCFQLNLSSNASFGKLRMAFWTVRPLLSKWIKELEVRFVAVNVVLRRSPVILVSLIAYCTVPCTTDSIVAQTAGLWRECRCHSFCKIPFWVFFLRKLLLFTSLASATGLRSVHFFCRPLIYYNFATSRNEGMGGKGKNVSFFFVFTLNKIFLLLLMFLLLQTVIPLDFSSSQKASIFNVWESFFRSREKNSFKIYVWNTVFLLFWCPFGETDRLIN